MTSISIAQGMVTGSILLLVVFRGIGDGCGLASIEYAILDSILLEEIFSVSRSISYVFDMITVLVVELLSALPDVSVCSARTGQINMDENPTNKNTINKASFKNNFFILPFFKKLQKKDPGQINI